MPWTTVVDTEIRTPGDVRVLLPPGLDLFGSAGRPGIHKVLYGRIDLVGELGTAERTFLPILMEGLVVCEEVPLVGPDA